MAGDIEDAKAFIAQSSLETEVMVGCDSKRFRKKVNGQWRNFAKYCTVVVVRIDGRRGCRLFHRMDILEEHNKPNKVKQRMLNEVMFGVGVALDIWDIVGERPFAFHIDINPNKNFASNAAMSEARGWVIGNLGIEPEFKPNSPAASFAADRLLHI